jgi:hypothetical protein
MRYIAVFPTLTLAKRAQRTLAASSVAAETVKVDSAKTMRGCSWGVIFHESQLYRAKMIFADAKIEVREILSEGG